MRFPHIKTSILSISASLIFFAFGCTDSPKNPEETVEADANANANANVEAAEVPDEMTNAGENELTNNEMAEEKPAEAPAPAAEDDAAQRVVRYVLIDNTPAYSQADENSPHSGVYHAGDSLLVKLNGDWAELNHQSFLKNSALSTKIVPRQRLNPWTEASPVCSVDF